MNVASLNKIALPGNPIIYEINTWIWLHELNLKYRKEITLANIPAREWDELASLGFNVIWLMGVWERSPAGLIIAKQHTGIMKDLREALPDLKEEDIVSSPYCIKGYHVDYHIGGSEGLAIARQELASRGLRLILDFVPNHVAPDHPWTISNPGFFISGTEEQMSNHPDDWYRAGKNIYAKAHDPFYPPWPDVLQLNIFDEGLRRTMVETLKIIAAQCDGIRCDMAMLVMNDIFSKTWSEKAEQKPELDFWASVIPEVKLQYPGFTFIAESYWDTEPALLNQGFDFCYDKRYYDYLIEGAEKSRQHLIEMMPVQEKLLRFLENHDEPRASRLFSIGRHKAIALASLTQPGARLLHDGQLEGRMVRVPVFLSRRQNEPENPDLKMFYRQLMKILKFDAIRIGRWALVKVSGWPDNLSYLNLLAWEWLGNHENLLFVINLSDQPAQGLVESSHSYLPGRTYQLFDVISGQLFDRDGENMNYPGLFAGLQPWGAHTFFIEH
ncbi:MAG: alpha-amylase family glycosyl hydrolase [Bacteroidales bacterium]|nr:alpha-amylase family glycosyl hydrolase [Bacteroidales bacterium]